LVWWRLYHHRLQVGRVKWDRSTGQHILGRSLRTLGGARFVAGADMTDAD
jgi:hypothetical protein